jgi:hypothetical protein
MFLKLFLNVMIKDIKIHNILDIIKISKSMEPNKCIAKQLWKCSVKCFLWFFKVQWVQENQGVIFLVVPPKDGFTLQSMTSMFMSKCVSSQLLKIYFQGFITIQIIEKVPQKFWDNGCQSQTWSHHPKGNMQIH